MVDPPPKHRNMAQEYRDLFHVDVEEIIKELPKNKRKGPRGGVILPFPVKLHKMLETTHENGMCDVVSWQKHGRCFALHKPADFARDILPRFFRQTKLTSFQRQLNLYGFQRVVSGKDRGGYYHEMFLRGRPDLARIIVRTPVKGQSNTQSIVGDDPDFYSYTVCEDGKSEATITFTEEPDCLDDNSEKRGSKNKQNDFTGPETTRAVMLAPNPPTSIHDTRSAVGGAFFDMLPETMIANPMARLPATFPGFIQNQFTPNPLTALQLMAARNPQARHTLASSVQLHQNPNLDEESLEQLRRLGRL